MSGHLRLCPLRHPLTYTALGDCFPHFRFWRTLAVSRLISSACCMVAVEMQKTFAG